MSDSLKPRRAPQFIGALLFALLFYLAMFSTRNHDTAFGLVLLLYPFVVGIGCTLILDTTGKTAFWYVFGMSLIVYVFLAIILISLGLETLICLFIGAPILLFGTGMGISMTQAILRDRERARNKPTLAVLLGLPFLLVFAPLEVTFPLSPERRVDSIEIAAPPQVVWANIITFPQIAPQERIWSISHNILGAPIPQRSTMEGDVRHAEWSMNVAYEEHITSMIPNAEMGWDIVFPADFKMDGIDTHIQPDSRQLKLLNGAYTLSYDGRVTTLTLRTDYQLRTLSNAYIQLWGGLFLGDNHRAILNVIKSRSETKS